MKGVTIFYDAMFSRYWATKGRGKWWLLDKGESTWEPAFDNTTYGLSQLTAKQIVPITDTDRLNWVIKQRIKVGPGLLGLNWSRSKIDAAIRRERKGAK